MNIQMAYLLGMICGNGSIQRLPTTTTVSIEIPHRKVITDNNLDVGVYVQASITNIRDLIEPLIGHSMRFIQNPHCTVLAFTFPNENYIIREIVRLFENATSQTFFRIHQEIFNASHAERIYFIKGLSDVTGYIRRSNYYISPYKHRVYIEVPRNWYLVADICNLLKSVNVPVQTIDWAHPNMRDGYLRKYNQNQANFWKKEHQIKIFANEFQPIGFSIIHKNGALTMLANELIQGFRTDNIDLSTTHRYYWELNESHRIKLIHPGEHDASLPIELRGLHFDSWRQIAEILGYQR